jgi:(p)ppGpp synthase/HD superfamily hydrolase
MIMTEKEALQFATEKHEGQTRKFSGKPYVQHPIRVAKTLKEMGAPEPIRMAALLHDTIEDTSATFEELKDKFGDRVAVLVRELTSIPDDQKRLGKVEMLSQKMMKMTSEALLIKLADRLDNVSDAASGSFKEKYRAETRTIIANISRRSLTAQHKSLMSRIQQKIED